MARVLSVLTSLAVAVAPATAAAYRTAADLDELAGADRVAWSTERVPYRLNDRGAPGIPLPDVERSLAAAVRTWTEPSCSEVPLAYAGVTPTTISPDDGVNTVQWVRSSWVERGFPSNAAATTDVLYRRTEDGRWEIAEADVYVNGADFSWHVGAGEPEGDQRALLPVLTHEMGHAAGLLHPCEPGGLDGAPDCSSDPAAAAATMYPLYMGPEQATLHEDDVAGICFLYPAAGCEDCRAGEVCTSEGCEPACGDGGCTEPAPTDCSTDEDCGSNHVCVFGACTEPGSPFEDYCESDADCRTGLCSAAGRCSFACMEDEDCPEGSTCDSGECAPRAGAFGESCSAPSDCLSDLCLLPDEGAAAFCTRSCDIAADNCPAEFGCDSVEGQYVCRPIAGSTGCSAAPGRTPGGIPLLMILVVMTCALRRRRQYLQTLLLACSITLAACGSSHESGPEGDAGPASVADGSAEDAPTRDGATACTECDPGDVETEDSALCGRRSRTCQDTCTWSEWVDDVPDGECEPGELSAVDGECELGFLGQRVCTETCTWGEPVCVDACLGTRRTEPEDAEERCVPEGEFERGHEDFFDAQPVRLVHVSSYYIDRFPVSNRRYLACMEAGGCSMPQHIDVRDYVDDPARAMHPVQGVSWQQALDFCDWDGGRRLPTEAEWEKSGRGPSPGSRVFPWGDEYDCDLLYSGACGLGSSGDLIVDAVGALPETVSVYGVEQLIASGLEWVNDRYISAYYSDDGSLDDPMGPEAGAERVQRGALKGFPEARDFNLARRLQERAVDPSVFSTFRCARSAE